MLVQTFGLKMYLNVGSLLKEPFTCSFCILKEELSGMKGRLQVVVLENEELHQKLKFLTTEHMWREQTLLDASVSFYFSVVVLISVQGPTPFKMLIHKLNFSQNFMKICKCGFLWITSLSQVSNLNNFFLLALVSYCDENHKI